MDSGRLKGVGRLIKVKTIEKHSLGLDYWPPNRAGRLMGGGLIRVGLYFQVSFSLKVILYAAKITQNTMTEILQQ